MGRRLGQAANVVLMLGALVCVVVCAFLVWRHGMSFRYVGLMVSPSCWRVPYSCRNRSR